jgi:hypothetical protein
VNGKLFIENNLAVFVTNLRMMYCEFCKFGRFVDFNTFFHVT